MSKLRNLVIPILILILFITMYPDSTKVYADRGGIPVNPVTVLEPGQYAIISWYRGVEVLYLSTYVVSDYPTYMLEILPLPSVPKIYLGDKSVFDKLGSLLSRKVYVENYGFGVPGYRGPGAGGGISLIETFSAGPHNVTVVEVGDGSKLVEFMITFSNQNGLDISEGLKAYPNLVDGINGYIKRGYKYFAIDIIYIEKTTGMLIEPIIYEFKSEKIYFPMEISAITYTEDFRLHLFIITTHPLDKEFFEEYGARNTAWPYEFITASVTRYELDIIDSKLTKIFPPWIIGLYLNYVYMIGNYLSLEDIEIADNYDITPLLTIVGILLITLFAAVLYKYYDINKMRNNRDFLIKSIAIIVIPGIMMMTNLVSLLCLPILSHYITLSMILIAISSGTAYSYTKTSMKSATPSYSKKFTIAIAIIGIGIIFYISSVIIYQSLLYSGVIIFVYLIAVIITILIFSLIGILIVLLLLYRKVTKLHHQVSQQLTESIK